jgi:hypothetical protein
MADQAAKYAACGEIDFRRKDKWCSDQNVWMQTLTWNAA